MKYAKLDYKLYDVISELDDIAAGKLLKAILAFGNDLEIEDLPSDARLIYRMLRVQLDRDMDVHSRQVEAGRTHGRGRKQTTEEVVQDTNSIILPTDDEIEPDNDAIETAMIPAAKTCYTPIGFDREPVTDEEYNVFADNTTKSTAVDDGWMNVVTAYQDRIGIFPAGNMAKKLVDDYECFGANKQAADIMLEAITLTDRAKVENPCGYLHKILTNWFHEGLDTIDKVRSDIAEREQRRSADRYKASPPKQRNPLDDAPFY